MFWLLEACHHQDSQICKHSFKNRELRTTKRNQRKHILNPNDVVIMYSYFPRYPPRIYNENTNVVHMTRNDLPFLISLRQTHVPSSPCAPSSRRGPSDRRHPRTFVVFHLPLKIRQAGKDLPIDDIRVTSGIYFVHISTCNIASKKTLTTAMRCMNMFLV